MLVDDFEQYQNDKTDDVVVSQSGSDEPESEPLADDRENLSPAALGVRCHKPRTSFRPVQLGSRPPAEVSGLSFSRC